MDKRMLIIDSDVIKRIDENRGDMSYSEFINFLINNLLKENHPKEDYATKNELISLERNLKEVLHSHSRDNSVSKEDLQRLEQSVKEVLHSFLEFFLSYGLELGKPPSNQEFAELDRRLQGLNSFSARG
jgi:hypothetical protein